MFTRKTYFFMISSAFLFLILILIPVNALSSPPNTDLVQTLQEQTGGTVQISYQAETGRVSFISADPAHPIPQGAKLMQAATSEQAARQFLGEYGTLFGLSDPGQELSLMEEQQADEGRSFVRFQQVTSQAGSPAIPVMGGELIVQLNQAREVLSANGRVLPEIKVDPNPSISPEAAQQTARSSVAKENAVSADQLTATKPELWVYNPLLLGDPGVRINALVWRMEVTDLEGLNIKELVLVDAHLGTVPLHFSELESAKYRKIYDNNNNSSAGLPGPNLARIEGQGPTGNADVDNAYNFGGLVYDFYKNVHNRDSLDGAGMQLISTVRYCNTSSSCPYANAFWNGSQMVYGQDYASGLDVVGHEMTHGVTDHTSRLFYYMQSGAINESLSDIWGELIQRYNNVNLNDQWQMGESLPIGAIRSMSNPTLFGDPDAMTSGNYYCGTDDGGGVHTNSGVGNKAAYLMVAGGTFNGKNVTPLHGGILEVAKIYYEAQVHLLTSASDYAALYDSLRQACSNLLSSGVTNAADCQSVTNALQAVAMNQQPSACAAPEAPVCPAGKIPASLFSDNLENPTSGNWARGSTIGSDEWYYPQNPNPYQFDATYATSGQYNFWGYDVITRADYTIGMTKNIALPAGTSPYLRYNSAFSFEVGGFDGGVIEYSTNSGATWSDAGPLMLNNGYNGTISNAYDNPLGGRPGFISTSNGYTSTRLNLASLAGKPVRFRFRIGTDSGNDDYGWFIDDISVYTCVNANNTLLPLILRGGQPLPAPTPTPPAQSWQNLVSTSFEGDFPGPWQLEDLSNNDNGEYLWGSKACKAYAGSNSGWAVGGGSGGSGLGCGAHYPNNVYTWMTYGPFSLVNATDAEMNFKIWVNSETSYDKASYMASTDGYYFYGRSLSGNSNGWLDRSFDLTNVTSLGDLRGKPQVWVALLFESDGINNYPEGAYIDNVVLRRCNSASCGAAVLEQDPASSNVVETETNATRVR